MAKPAITSSLRLETNIMSNRYNNAQGKNVVQVKNGYGNSV